MLASELPEFVNKVFELSGMTCNTVRNIVRLPSVSGQITDTQYGMKWLFL